MPGCEPVRGLRPLTNPSASPSSSAADVAGETFQRIEVISGTGRRRKWSRRRKESIVLETLEEGASVSEVARGHGVDVSQVFKWRRDAGLRSRPSTSETVMFAPLLIEQKDAPQPEHKEADRT
jgi:transposase-like protein